MADDFLKAGNSYVGVGGRNCPCCNGYFGKDRKKLNRWARRKLKRLTKKIVREEIFD